MPSAVCNQYLLQDFLFGFNLACTLCGLVTAITGCSLYVHIGRNDTTTCFLIIGAFVLCTSIIGCCGGILASTDSRRRQPLLITYVLLMVLLLIVQVNVGVYTVLDYGGILRQTVDTLWLAAREANATVEAVQRWTDIERRLRCCGLHGSLDYGCAAETQLPASCCPPMVTGGMLSATSVCRPHAAMAVGCLNIFQRTFGTHFQMAGYLLLLLSGVQAATLVMGVYLATGSQ